MSAPKLADVVKGVSACFDEIAGPYQDLSAYVSLSFSWRTDGGQLLTFSISSTDGDDGPDEDDES